ncbi:MAG: excinuclease ABC subunit UvrA [Ornithinimicrobium sp.]
MPSESRPGDVIGVRGAQLHNLRSVDVDLPRDQLVAFTGISGSGKSSLAFGTIHGEAQRRYFDSVAPFARRLIHTALDPQVRDITGLPPTVALQQQRGGVSSRSSVGTITTTASTLRMLWSRCGDYPPDVAPMDSDHFSANTAAGACPQCSGLGRVHRPTEDSMVPDPSLSIAGGAIAAWPGAWQGKNYRDIVATLGYDIHLPWRDLPQADRDFILFSTSQPVVTVVPERAAGRVHRPYEGRFVSAERYLMRTLSETQSASGRARALRYVVTSPCSMCDGRRLEPNALAVTWQGLAIDEAARLPIEDVLTIMARRLEQLELDQPTAPHTPVEHEVAAPHTPVEHEIAALEGDLRAKLQGHAAGPSTPSGLSGAASAAERVLLHDLTSHLQVIADLGIGHLDLGRSSTSVSSGELQRLRLATSLRSGLFGVVYVLDEPSAGLHPRDTAALITVLRELVRTGNTVLLVEHDMSVVAQCDWVVDVGPGAGREGGHILYSGALDGLDEVETSVTAKYRHNYVHASDLREQPDAVREAVGELRIEAITRHTVGGLDLTVPLGVLTVIAGVSGSGKSTVLDVLRDALGSDIARVDQPDEDDVPSAEAGTAHRNVYHDSGNANTRRNGEEDRDRTEDGDEARPPGAGVTTPEFGAVTASGDGVPARLVRITQKPIGRTPRSNLATYTGLFDRVRALFAATPLARERGYRVGRFSFNVAAGRCPTCQGEGHVAVELLFLPGTYSICPTCHGARYNPETLEVTWQGQTISDVLSLTVAQAIPVFADEPRIARALTALFRLGLGYLTLGQPATELSGGEAQRIKMATELQTERRESTLYLLDEPTSGLHPADAHRLLRQLHALVDQGHTVVMAEHHPAALATADWIIELGPGAGAAGGQVVHADRRR